METSLKKNLGLENDEYNYLVDTVTHIIHAAADIRLNASIEDLRKINVNGTENLIKLASDAHKNHGILRFSHLSTAYVAGRQDRSSYQKIHSTMIMDFLVTMKK